MQRYDSASEGSYHAWNLYKTASLFFMFCAPSTPLDALEAASHLFERRMKGMQLRVEHAHVFAQRHGDGLATVTTEGGDDSLMMPEGPH